MRIAPLALLIAVLSLRTAHADKLMGAAKQELCLQDEKCSQHYKTAKELRDTGKLTQAIEEYEAAYTEIQIPVFLFNIGRLHHRVGNLDKAAAYYRRYLGAAMDDEPKPKALAKQYLEELELRPKEPTIASVVPPSPSPSASPDPAQKPIYKKWWFWTAIGGGAALVIIVGAAAGTAASRTSSQQFPADVPVDTFVF